MTECLTIEEACSEILDRRGLTPKKLGSDFTDSGYRVISAKLITEAGLELDRDNPRFVDQATYKKWMSSPLLEGDVLLTSEAPTGRVAYIKEKKEWCLGQRLFCLRPSEKVSGRYLYYALQSPTVFWELTSRGTGTTVVGIRQSSLREVTIPIPAKEDQKAIAHILGTLDDKIELNQKMNQTLEEIAKAIFKSWFVDFDPVRAKAEGRPTGLPSEISDLFPDELVDSEIGGIPKGWNVFKVKDEAIRLKVGKLYSNKTVEHEGSIPVLDQSDAGIIGYHSNDEFVSASLENPVFTFANHTCKMRLLFSDFGVIQNVIPIQSKSYPTIWFYLRTLGVKQFEEYKGHIPDFMDTQLCFPSVQLAESLNQLVTPLFHRIEIANREIGVLSDLRDTLLPKLISGELRIPDAEKFLEEAGI